MKPSALLSSRSALMMFLWMASITITTCCFATAFSSTSQMISTTNKLIIGNNNDKLLLFLHQHHRAKKIVIPSSNVSRQPQRIIIFPSTTRLHAAENNDNNNIDPSRIVTNDLGLDIVRGTGIDNADEISDQTWEEIEGSAPSKLMIVKNLLGINIFTYILAALIVFFLSMNAIFGVGWLGQSLGWEDVGTFTKVSESLPLDVDVSGSDYLL